MTQERDDYRGDRQEPKGKLDLIQGLTLGLDSTLVVTDGKRIHLVFSVTVPEGVKPSDAHVYLSTGADRLRTGVVTGNIKGESSVHELPQVAPPNSNVHNYSE